jgi:hypothetical protein
MALTNFERKTQEMKPNLQLAPTPEPKRPLTLFEREDEARADILDLARESDQKALEADKAERRYTETREPMDRLERDCAIDRHQDAQRALEALKQEHAPLFAEADLARRTARLETLLVPLGTPLTALAEYGRLLDLVADFRRDLIGRTHALREALARRSAIATEATQLASSLGRGERFIPTSIADLLPGLASTVVSASRDITPDTLLFSIFSMSGGNDTERLKFELNLSTKGDNK